MANSSLVDVVVRADPGNYTSGRGGYKINHITIHHMAGILTAAQCGAIFAKKGRNGSSNYGVGSDGKVGLYVNESDRAWCDSNWNSNCTTVSIETSNSKTGGEWPVSATTFNKLIKLVADIAKRNGLGKLVPGKNLTWHSMYTATACPGDWLRGHMQELADKANAINYPPAPAKAELIWTKADKVEEYACNKQPTNLWSFDSATWGGCKSVKTFNKGDKVDIYGSVLNKTLGATYLLTEYSFTKKITNGFNVVDMDKVEKPAPVPATPTWKDVPAEIYVATKDVNLYNIITGAVVSSYKKGTEVSIVQTTEWGGVEYGRTEWSRDNNLNNGFKMSEMAKVQPPAPTPEPEPTPEPTPEPEPEDPTVGILQKIIEFIQHIIDLITKKEK